MNAQNIVTFNPFPEVIAVPPYRCEFAQVVVGAPDVHIFILWAADDEGVVMAVRTKNNRNKDKNNKNFSANVL